MKNVWYNKDIILKIECCSVDNLQGLIREPLKTPVEHLERQIYL